MPIPTSLRRTLTITTRPHRSLEWQLTIRGSCHELSPRVGEILCWDHQGRSNPRSSLWCNPHTCTSWTIRLRVDRIFIPVADALLIVNVVRIAFLRLDASLLCWLLFIEESHLPSIGFVSPMSSEGNSLSASGHVRAFVSPRLCIKMHIDNESRYEETKRDIDWFIGPRIDILLGKTGTDIEFSRRSHFPGGISQT